MSAASPRIPPLPKEEWSDDAVAALKSVYGEKAAESLLSDEPESMPMPTVLTTFMHHPGLAGPYLTYSQVLLKQPTVEPRLRELMVLRVAWLTRSSYEWVQHVRLAPRFEITTDDIDAIEHGADAERWTPLEADLLRATDQLLDHYRIDDETWKRLAEHLDVCQLIEVPFIIGTYAGLAMALNSFGIELDPELDGIAAPLPPVDE